MTDIKMMDKRFILLDKKDNVLACCGPVTAGERICLGTEVVEMQAAIDIGHKISTRDITKGEKIIKYGASIGSAIEDIGIGQHVHLHNMRSDYISSHTRVSKVEVTK